MFAFLDNVSIGLGCKFSNATTEAEFTLDPNMLASELNPEEDKWTDEELVKCFEHEACRIKASFQEINAEELAKSIGVRWLRRVEKDKADVKLGGRHLRALLRSRAIDIYLGALTRSQVGRKAIYIAASIDPERESLESADISLAVPLRLLLAQASDATPVVMDSLLLLLSDVAERSAAAVPKSSELAAVNQDLQWVLLMMSAAAIDFTEVPVRMSSNTHKAVRAKIQELLEWWKAIVLPLGEPFVDRFEVGTEVWAEYPRNGRWFRAQIKEVAAEHCMVQWHERPGNVKGGHEDDYVVSTVGEGFNYEQTSAVLKIAIIPDKYQRPQPIPEAEEEGWSSLIEAAEKLTAKFHGLRSLFEDLGKDSPKELKKMKEWEEKKSAEAVRTLDATAESIRALKKDFQKRAQACNGSLPKFLSDAVELSGDVETLVLQRLTAAHSLVGSHDRLVGLRTNVANACIEAEQLRGRQLEELLNGLHSAIYGEDAAFVVQDAMSVQSTKQVITTAMKLADQAWREAVQFAAETLDGPLFVGCEDISRAAKRYKEFRLELKKVQERLAMLERNPPELPPTRKRQVYKKSASFAILEQDAAQPAQGKEAKEAAATATPATASAAAPATVSAPAPAAPEAEAFPEVDFSSAAAVAAFEVTPPPPPVPAPSEPSQPAPQPRKPPSAKVEVASSAPEAAEAKASHAKAQPTSTAPPPVAPDVKKAPNETGCGTFLGRLSTRCCGAS